MSVDELEAIATDLQNRLSLDQLKKLVNLSSPDIARKIPRILANNGLVSRPITDAYALARILADPHGGELLRMKEVRAAILERANDETLIELLAASGKNGRRRAEKISGISTHNWHAGKYWARSFVRILGLPTCMAGAIGESGVGSVETINPYRPLKPLHDFQDVLRGQVLDIISDASTGSRAILTLPTGAGKTRTTVEALIVFLRKDEQHAGSILWIAQSEELCEQAVASFREVWTEQLIKESQGTYLSAPRSLKIHRLWGRYSFSSDGFESGSVIVAGIKKLSEAPDIDPLLDQIAVLVVDEAHHAVAQSYKPLFLKLDAMNRPILGLTATPYRGSQKESDELRRQFRGCLLTPKLENPIEALRDRGILSRIEPEISATHRKFSLNPSELADVEKWHDLSKATLKRIGDDVERNRAILARLLAIPHRVPTLFFACTVEHSRLIALLLRRKNRTAASVTADTPDAMRRRWIQDFKDGSLQFLCNVGVLTTGFDAPRIEVIAIARPTGSVLLYEQMVGRGMRGPLNGGTDECLLIDFTDNFDNFSSTMTYACISQMWAESARQAQELISKPRVRPGASEAAR